MKDDIGYNPRSRPFVTPDDLTAEEYCSLLRGVQIWIKYKLFRLEDDPIMRGVLFATYGAVSTALLGFEEIRQTLTASKYSTSEVWKKDRE